MPCGLQVSCSTLCFCLFSGDIPKEVPDFRLFTYFFYFAHLSYDIYCLFSHLFSTFQRGNKSLRGKSTCRKQVCSFIPKGAFLCSPSTQSHHNCRYTGWFRFVVSYIIPASENENMCMLNDILLTFFYETMELESFIYFVKPQIPFCMNPINLSEIQKHWPTIFTSPVLIVALVITKVQDHQKSRVMKTCHFLHATPRIVHLQNHNGVFSSPSCNKELCAAWRPCWCHWVFRSSWPVTRFKVLPITGFQELMNMQPFTQMPCVGWYRHNLC